VAWPAGQVSLAVPARVAVNRSFVSPLIELFGDVWVCQGVLVTANTVLDAAPGGRICLGDDSNIQDNVVVRATHASACGPLAAQVERDAIVAHQATVANSTVGRFTFVGFRARLEDAVLDEGAFVLHGATVRGVRIGRDLQAGANAVLHGPLQAGDRLVVEADAVLFDATVGDDVTIGSEAVVAGVALPDGARVPAGATVTTQAQADALRAR
jgi:carbonic anhydrase/acetyltransferase-like protein (isoleucine patch superfamily)